MPTLKLDQIATDFINRIPTTFKTAFAPGTGVMPDTYLLGASRIVDYVNRAMNLLFNEKWEGAWKLSGGNAEMQIKIFNSLLPELVRFTGELVADAALAGTAYMISSPYLDFFKLIGAVSGDNSIFIKKWDETKYMLALTGVYDEFTPTAAKPAIIQVNEMLVIFPQDIADFTFKIQYIKLPLDPTTGGYLIQNGTYDSPFHTHWNRKIADIAYEIYLGEAYETT